MTRKKLVYLFSVLLFLAGCSQLPFSENTPPKLFLKIDNKQIETKLGTYCWGNQCVDKVGVKELLKDEEPIKVKAGEVIEFRIDYGEKPTEVVVRYIINEAEVEVPVVQNKVTAPKEKGFYYFYYTAWWMDKKKENTSKGDASYVFLLEVTEK